MGFSSKFVAQGSHRLDLPSYCHPSIMLPIINNDCVPPGQYKKCDYWGSWSRIESVLKPEQEESYEDGTMNYEQKQE